MKYGQIHSALRRLEAVLTPSLHEFTLNTGEVVLFTWDKFRDELTDVLAGRDTREAFVVRNTVATGDEWTAKNIECFEPLRPKAKPSSYGSRGLDSTRVGHLGEF